jgi:peptidoglycan/xylan/chitin deacetylase (PgdA/CDA1 family)
MSPWKSFLLHLYYYGSVPYRWWQSVQAVAEHRVPIAVLFYHRIADDGPTSWTLSNREFARHIDWLAGHFELISLEEVQRRVRAGDNTRPAVSITFDDGYAENCRQAIPLLVKKGIPCTYFATLGNVLSGEPFAHDVAKGYRFEPNNLEQLRAMAAAGIEIGVHTYTHADLGPITDRRELYREVVTAGRQLEQLVGQPVRYFAFPLGQHANLNARAFQMARSAGYEAVCSAYGGYNVPGGDSFHLKRIHADDMIRLKNRATIDPRKLNVPSLPWEPAKGSGFGVRDEGSQHHAAHPQ